MHGIVITITIITTIIIIPSDGNIESKERKKQEKYQDLARGISRIWRAKAKVVPVLVGALVVIRKNLKSHLKEIGFQS